METANVKQSAMSASIYGITARHLMLVMYALGGRRTYSNLRHSYIVSLLS